MGRIATGIVAATLPWGCSEEPPPAPVTLVIGIDGADWDILDPLIARGGMPHLARLRDEGVSGPLATLTELPISPVIWTSIATGKLPAKHGVTWFLVDAPDGGRVPVRSHNRRVKALWNILAEKDRPVGVVGWWATAPAEDVGSGVVVSDALGWHGFGSSGRGMADAEKVWPAQRASEFASLIPPLQQIDFEFARRFFRLDAREYYERSFQPSRSSEPDPANPIQLFQEYAATTIGYGASAHRILEGGATDLLLVYFESTDSLSHLFMKYAPPRQEHVSAEDFEKYGEVVDRWYEYVDEKIGGLVAAAPAGSTVVVVSDHGFRIGAERPRSEQTIDVRGAHLDHDPIGIFVANGPGFRRGARIEGASVLDVAPTLLHCLGEAVASDMDGRVLTDAFSPEFMKAHPIRWVASYESAASAPVSASAPAPATLPSSEGSEFDDEEAISRLRRLGYVADGEEEPASGAASSVEQHMNLGSVLLGRGDLEGARREYEAAVRLAPDAASPLVGLSRVARAEGRDEEALRCLARALTLDPDCVDALLELASIRKDREELRIAEALYRQALALDARQPGPWVSLGDVLARQSRLDEAEQALRHALELDPRSLEGRYNLGVVHMQRGESAQAEADYRAALELDPRHAASLNNLGHLLNASGRLEEALSAFRAAAEADAKHFESRFNLGSILLANARAEEAVPWFEAALALQPEHLLTQFHGARALAAAGRREEARRRLVAMARMFPLDPNSCIELARLDAADGRDETARSWIQEAARRGGPNAATAIRNDPAFRGLDLDSLLGVKR